MDMQKDKSLGKKWKNLGNVRKSKIDTDLNQSFESQSRSVSSQKFAKFRTQKNSQNLTDRKHIFPSYISKLKQRSMNGSFISSCAISPKNAEIKQKGLKSITDKFIQQSPIKTVSGIEHKEIKLLLRKIRNANNSLKDLLVYFDRKIKEMKEEWQSSLETILKQQYDQQKMPLIFQVDSAKFIENIDLPKIEHFASTMTKKVSTNAVEQIKSTGSQYNFKTKLSQDNLHNPKKRDYTTAQIESQKNESLFNYQHTPQKPKQKPISLKTMNKIISQMKDILDS